MKQTLTRAITILALTLTTTSLYAQVTIGSNTPPNKGVLLDLTEGSTTTKGLALPRVKLTKLKPTSNSDLAASIGNTADSYDLDDHVGLVVYNIEPQVFNLAICEMTGAPVGLYVWDGTEWQSLQGSSASSVYEVTDPRDNNIYHYRNFGAAGDWMLENMCYDPISHPHASFTNYTEKATDPFPISNNKYFAYPDVDGKYRPNYHPSANWDKRNGILYNWAAATNNQNITIDNQGQGETQEGPTTPVQGICPSGWHLPSDREWNQLEKELYNYADQYSSYNATEKATWSPNTWNPAWETLTYFRGSTANGGHGLVMASPCEAKGSTKGPTGGKSLSTAQGGFNALFIGYAYDNSLVNYGMGAYFWSASAYYGGNAWWRCVERQKLPVNVNKGAYDRNVLHSVRCKKD